MRLSREIGIPFNELSERIDTEELTLYEMIENEYPSLPDPWRINALNCRTIANTAFGSKGHAEMDHFMPFKRRKTDAENIAIAQMLAARAKSIKGE